MQKGYVYIVQDIKDRAYVGSTNNVGRRWRQHELGHTQTTRNMDSPKIVLAQEFSSLAEARRVERKIKKLKRKDYIKKMIEDGYIKLK